MSLRILNRPLLPLVVLTLAAAPATAQMVPVERAPVATPAAPPPPQSPSLPPPVTPTIGAPLPLPTLSAAQAAFLASWVRGGAHQGLTYRQRSASER